MLAALVVDTLTPKRNHFRFLYTSHYLLNRRTIFGFLSDFILSLFLPHSIRNAIDRSFRYRSRKSSTQQDRSIYLVFSSRRSGFDLSNFWDQRQSFTSSFFRYFVRFQLIGGRHLLYVVSYIDQREILQQLTV